MAAEEKQIKKLYQAYRHTADIDRKGLFFSPTCMQICRPVPSYAATSRDGIVRYFKDAQVGNVPVENSSRKSGKNKEEHATAHGNVGALNDSHPDARSKHGKSDHQPPKSDATELRAVYTIRPLHEAEHEFSTNTITAPVGFNAAALQAKARQERWIGMRVDLWDEGSPASGLLVKVQYWWRWEAVSKGEEMEGDVEGFGWRQCMHDIMYLGKKDGTEGEEGLQVLE